MSQEAVQRILDDLADMPLPGQGLVIHAPCAAAQGDASMNSSTEEAGDGLD